MLLQAKPPIRSSPGSTIEEIVGVVSRAERLSVAELRGRGQSVRRAFARSLAALLAWREAGIPVSRVADYFGRDESTLVKGIRRLEDASVSDERLRSRIHAISKRLPSRSSGVHG
jgi:chromosomal replication initiation ATPase DnaA